MRKDIISLIKPDRSLNAKFTEAYKELGLTSTKKDSREKKADDMVKARDYMCKNYFECQNFRCSYVYR